MQPARPGGPALISLTRLRLASVRHLPGFAWHTARSALQARRTPGFLGLQLLADRRLTFWTATAWTDLAAMKRFHGAGAHRKAMPKLAAWCDEASVTRWAGEPGALGDWAGAHARMVEAGEPSAVRRPSAAHSAGAYAPPRLRRPLVLRLGASPVQTT